jgi:hypothetical protein
MYWPQVWPAGGLKMLVSASAHTTWRPWSMAAAMPATQYVSGETRYMKIQKPGRASGVCITPLKIRVMEKRRVRIAEAVCASGKAAIHSCPNVEA